MTRVGALSRRGAPREDSGSYDKAISTAYKSRPARRASREDQVIVAALLACLGGAGTPTPIRQADLARVLDQAHVAVFHVRPSRPRLLVAVAQTLLEGARFSRCHNLGSVSARRGQAYWRPRGVGQRMRSYRSFDAGAQAYWRAVCKPALERFDAGDARGAAMALGGCRYYTANREAYAKAMVAVLKGLKP